MRGKKRSFFFCDWAADNASFLEEQKNTDLIRWSDKGDSFIVLDEDEFAKTLIPELFKHNNYASFVRQLNMYGFHKRVGLSDNSMKASERKNKSPSEYYNPFFRRGHPNLLWLINKPKSGNKSKKGKKEDGDADSEEEVGIEDMAGQSFVGPATQHVASSLAGEVVPLQKKDLQAVREQLGELQQKQRAISAAINKLNHDHNNLSTIFQNMHARHETSINAILSFLANVFRKQLEEQGAAQSVTELLASIMPNAQVPQGNVYDLSDLGDLGDFVPQQTPSSTAVSPLRRPQRLLPPIPNPGNVTAMSSPASNTSPATFNHELPSGQMGSVTELYDTPSDTTSPNYLQQELQKNPQERMMKIIQDTNAATTPSPVDLPPMGARTPVNLSNDQRDKVLSIMSGMRTPPAPVAGGAPAPAPAPAPGTLPGTTPNLRSPILPSIPRASINEIKATQQEIQALQRMQEEQDAKIEDLNQILGPLSPSGRVTPMGESGAGIPEQDYFDVNQYLNTNAFDLNFGGGDYNVPDPGPVDGNDYNFTLDGVFDPGAAALFGPGPLAPGVKTQEGGNTTPSPAGTEEIMRSGVDTTTPMRDNKRRRVE